MSDPAALRREELKYAHLSGRDSEIRRDNRAALAEHIAGILGELDKMDEADRA